MSVSDLDYKNKYLDYNDILKLHEELKNNVEKIKDKNNLDKNEYNLILYYFVFSLYIYIPPRRNSDYLNCYIIINKPKLLDQDKNYLYKNKFIFNNYKTSKTFGQ